MSNHSNLTTGDVILQAPPQNGGIISDQTRHLFEVVVYTVMCGVISVIGISTNIINITVFYRQGVMMDSSNTSLLGLAIADFCCLATMLWLSINYAVMLTEPSGLPWDPLSVLYITGGWPHVMFTRVTCWITGFIALERCVCVTLPFKVKLLFTPRRSLTVVVSIFLLIMITYSPIFYTHRLQWRRLTDGTNQSKLVLVFTKNKDQVENICHYINDVILPTACLSIVMVCTKVTVSKIHSSSQWRKSVTASGGTATAATATSATSMEVGKVSYSKPQGKLLKQSQSSLDNDSASHATIHRSNPDASSSDLYATSVPAAIKSNKKSGKPEQSHTQTTTTSAPAVNNSNKKTGKPEQNHTQTTSQKEKKVTRMVTLICTIFLVCNTPCILIIYLRFLVPEIANMGRYHNLFHVIYSIDFLLETFNSTINIVVYYTMSSRYKQEFNKLFSIDKSS